MKSYKKKRKQEKNFWNLVNYKYMVSIFIGSIKNYGLQKRRIFLLKYCLLRKSNLRVRLNLIQEIKWTIIPLKVLQTYWTHKIMTKITFSLFTDFDIDLFKELRLYEKNLVHILHNFRCRRRTYFFCSLSSAKTQFPLAI
jgi:hypothetical protein